MRVGGVVYVGGRFWLPPRPDPSSEREIPSVSNDIPIVKPFLIPNRPTTSPNRLIHPYYKVIVSSPTDPRRGLYLPQNGRPINYSSPYPGCRYQFVPFFTRTRLAP